MDRPIAIDMQHDPSQLSFALHPQSLSNNSIIELFSTSAIFGRALRGDLGIPIGQEFAANIVKNSKSEAARVVAVKCTNQISRSKWDPPSHRNVRRRHPTSRRPNKLPLIPWRPSSLRARTYREQGLNIPPSHRNVRRPHKLTLITRSLLATSARAVRFSLSCSLWWNDLLDEEAIHSFLFVFLCSLICFSGVSFR
jgi:hypothetical protein